MRKCVIFDMGGVLIDLDVDACKAAFREGLGYTHADTIIDACHQKGIVGDLEEGSLEPDEFRRLVLAASRPDAVAEDVDRAFWKILVRIQPYKAELLRKMADKYDLYMLSNNNPICLPRSAAMFAEAGVPLDVVFRKCFMSFEMNALKPSEKFYKAVLAQIDEPAENLLFIDDSQANVDGAVAAGLPAVYYQPGSDLSALLADVLEDPSLKMEGIN
jgi:putative hydrolase of the HAD superfamily